MNSRATENRATAWAMATGLILPILLIAAFLACARAKLGPAAGAELAEAPRPAPSTPVIETASMGGSSYGYSDGEGRDFFWAIVESRGSKGRQTIGSTDDRAQEAIDWALRRNKGKFLYLRLEDRDYIVRDPQIIARAERVVKPMQELGQRMGELGARQGELGARQGSLGGEQGRLGARQGALGIRQAEIAFKRHDRERRGLSTRDLDREQERIDAEMESCSRAQRLLGERQSELGARQAVLGEKQGRYGEEMNRVSRDVGREMRKLARQALESGEAQELDTIDA